MSESKALLGESSKAISVEGAPDEYQVCCFKAPCLAKVPVVRKVFRKKTEEEKGTFSSSVAVLLSMLGSVVGTGNIWRFPRIVANHAGGGGALVFLIVWFCFLWLWSMPIILIEYGIGRFTKKSTVESFNKLLGPSYRFLGGFQGCVGFCLGSYYSVLVGWCAYYLLTSVIQELPETRTDSEIIWNYMQDSSWPILCHFLAILTAGLSVSRGVSTIEPVNKVIVPILLLIVVICFYWAIFLDFADRGIVHMFSPEWSSISKPQLWLDAISQNAWDTGAGLGTFLTYATFMRRDQGAVKLGSMTPFLNNIVSLMCGILIFSTVFSVQTAEGMSKDEIVDTLQFAGGEGNTGLTFIWMPLLFQNFGGAGRFMAIIFFVCLTFAGLSSLISLMEMPVHILTDFGLHRIPATVLVGVCMFLLGVVSAVDTKILVNQDSVWAYAMILSGVFLLYLVIRYGPLRFRRDLYNDYGIGDWPLPIIWVIIVVFIAPIEGIGLIIWWMVDTIIDNSDWWEITYDSLAVTLVEWAFLLLIMIGLNWWIKPLVIHPPQNPKARKILGFFFKLTPVARLDFEDDDTSPPEYTPPASPQVEYGTMARKQSVDTGNSFALHGGKNKVPPQDTKNSVVISDVEL